MAKKIIVVIDDSQTVREQVSIVLTEAGYEVLEAEDGVEGASAIRGNPSAALAICDVNMPRLGGLEMLDTLHADCSRPAFPMIMLTTEGRADLMDRARAKGAKAWIVKPFKSTLLLAAVRKLAGNPT